MVTMEDLQEHIAVCTKCDLCEKRTNAVLGDGNPKAKIMLIGEGPGEQEDLKGKAFVGKAGQLLDKMLAAIGLDRTNTYICNVVKCRPPGNRNPTKEEATACMDYLRHQFLIIKPKVIILLGSVAAKNIIDDTFSIMRSHGISFERKGVVFIPTFHPAALLRDESKKKLAWQDLQTAKKHIEELDAKIE